MRRSALAILALAGCSSQAQPTTISMHEPTAVVAFMGWTPLRPRPAYPVPQPYLALANARSNDLRLVDLATQKPLMSPGYAFPLAIPTLARPTFLAATSLRDGGADLLAVAGLGATVDVVGTWVDGSDPTAGAGPRVVAQYDLSGFVGAGAEILAMIATPVPGAPAGSPPAAPAQPGLAWLIIAFSGSSSGGLDGIPPGVGKLVVLAFARGVDGSVELGAPPEAKPLQLDPVSLAVAPDLFHLYVATPDVITDFDIFPPAAGARQVQGVAEIDMSAGAAAPWPVRGLDARSPTALVAAASIGERGPDDPDLYGPPALRVYAALDPSGCGALQPIDCGIAVIDPSRGGLAADIAPPGPIVPAQPYRAPIQVAAAPLALAVALPSASGALQCLADNDPCNVPVEPNPPSPNRQPLMRLLANGQRWTPAVGAAGASDGRTYLLDLGRSGPASDASLLNDDATRAAVTGAESFTPVQADGSAGKAGLGLYRQYPPQSQEFTTDSRKLPQAVVITPGFTRGETWTLVWQGFLPGLRAQDFVLGLEGADLYLAFQTEMGGTWDVGARVGDPALGIHPVDLVQFSLPDAQFVGEVNPCALAEGTRYEAVIASIVPATDPPSPIHPGGALQLVLPPDPASDPFQLLCLRDYLVAAAPGAFLAGTDGGVRTSGLVLTGSISGYAGRPPLLSRDDMETGQQASKRFNLAWQNESTLSGEELVLARKARRFFYPNDSYSSGGANYPETCSDPLASPPTGCNPTTPGVAIGLIAGPMCADEPPGSGRQSICPPERLGDLQRDSTLIITTRSGVSPTFRASVPSSLPSSAIAFDRSYFPDGGDSGSVFYVTYRQDSLLVAVPGQTPNISTALR
ncbi:MAG TPA: hypothetical protein VFR85_16590 [Anaeromyxobacteraceae bacterium]|nr:hypothetical protein [Anaeromyxobacteraceae bacterium]